MSDVLLVHKQEPSYLMVPVEAVKADLVTKTGTIMYVPLASTTHPGIVQVGEGLLISGEGLLSLDRSEIPIKSISKNGTLIAPDANKNVNIELVKADVGLGNVDNTSDLNKPISTLQQAAFDTKFDKYQGTENFDKTVVVGADGYLKLVNVSSRLSVLYDDESYSDITEALNFSSNFDLTKSGRQVNIDIGSSITSDISNLKQTIETYGDVVTHDADEFATSTQGGKADTALQPNDNVSELVNDAGYLTQHQDISGKLDKKPDGTNDLITNNKVSVLYLPDQILGQLLYGGTVNGSTGVATLTPNAKARLGVTSNTITLTNDTTAITGYGANDGIYYIVSDDGAFASLGLLVGDWLLSVGTAWKKIDNTDAVTGVKGDKESSYRIGNINITPANIGAEPEFNKNTAFNKDFETTATNIKMNGTQSVGSLSTVARADHVHPSDTSKQDVIDSTHKLSADLIEDGTTNKVFTATEKTKLSGIESGAEVNDVEGVTVDGSSILDNKIAKLVTKNGNYNASTNKLLAEDALNNYYTKTQTYTKTEADNLISAKQDATDNRLNTTNKTIVGSINELKSTSDTHNGQIQGLLTTTLNQGIKIDGKVDIAVIDPNNSKHISSVANIVGELDEGVLISGTNVDFDSATFATYTHDSYTLKSVYEAEDSSYKYESELKLSHGDYTEDSGAPVLTYEIKNDDDLKFQSVIGEDITVLQYITATEEYPDNFTGFQMAPNAFAFGTSYEDEIGVLSIGPGAVIVETTGEFSYNGEEVATVDQIVTYENKAASQGGTDESLVTTGDKYVWNNKQNALPTTSIAGKILKSTSTAGTVEWDDLPASTPTVVKVDNTSITSQGVANLQTISGDYDASTNKIATQKNIPLYNANEYKAFTYYEYFADYHPVPSTISAGMTSIPKFNLSKFTDLAVGDKILIFCRWYCTRPSAGYDYTDTHDMVLTATISSTTQSQGRYSLSNISELSADQLSGIGETRKLAYKTEVDAKQDSLTFDSTPTQNSINPVTSGGVYTALSGKANNSAVVKLTGDQTVGGQKTFSNNIIANQNVNVNWELIAESGSAYYDDDWYALTSHISINVPDTDQLPSSPTGDVLPEANVTIASTICHDSGEDTIEYFIGPHEVKTGQYGTYIAPKDYNELILIGDKIKAYGGIRILDSSHDSYVDDGGLITYDSSTHTFTI